MQYRRMPIEVESPEQLGYHTIDCNLTESSVRDLTLRDLDTRLDDLVLAYTDHRGHPELRAAVAADAGLQPDHVLTTAGAAAALFIVATTLLEPGDHLIVAHPNYATNLETPMAIGAALEPLPLRFEEGFQLDIDRLKAMIRPTTRLISLTQPQNPTGVMLSADALRDAIRLAEHTGCYLLLDETYRALTDNVTLPVAAQLSDRVISVSSLSKAYGLPGLRVGWLCAQDDGLQERLLAAKEQISICGSVLDETLGLLALQKGDALLAPIRKRSRAAFEEVKAWLAGQPLLEWVEPTGGVVGFPRIRAEAGVDVERFYQVLNHTHRTYVGPGHWFGMDRRYMRIGYGWPLPDELTRGLHHIDLALEAARR